MTTLQAPRTGQGTVGQWLRAIGLAAVSLILFYLALAAGEQASLAGNSGYVPQVEVARLKDAEGLPPGPWMPVALHPAPVYRFADSERATMAVFRHQFSRPKTTRPLGLYLTWKRRVAEVSLNGQALSARTPVQPPTAAGGFDPVIFEIPESLLRPEGNELRFKVLGTRLKILPTFFIGELEAQYEAYAWSRLITVELVVASIGIMLFITLLCLAIPWSDPERQRARALMLLLVAWSVRNLSFFGWDGLLSGVWQQVVHYQVTFCFLLALAGFAASWTQVRYGFERVYMAAAIGLCLLAAALGLLGNPGLVFRWLFPVESLLTLGVVATAGVQFLRYGAAGGWSRRYESVLFCVCLVAVGVDALDDRYNLSVPFLPELYLTFYTAPVCGLLLALGSITILVRQSQRARHLVENLNQELDSRLTVQQRYLNEAHQREQQLASERAVLKERQRLMRDMHDGLGGQLTSLLVRLRRGKASSDDALRDVGQALDDLRLIVSSMDHADETLGIALGAFRERMEPRLRDAGLTLGWHLEPNAAACRLGVADVLNVLRFLQEACSNVLRHAHASRIDCRLVQHHNGTVELSVKDNGRGFSGRAPAGNGLKNMNARAEQLGGSFQHESGEGGTRITLAFEPRQLSACAS